jgi:aryl-alcohol dehydrogenase-like predicted oxidoreductase
MNGGDGSVTNSPAHIKEYIEGTIERLGFTPDLYYLHRIDPSMQPILYSECPLTSPMQTLHSSSP